MALLLYNSVPGMNRSYFEMNVFTGYYQHYPHPIQPAHVYFTVGLTRHRTILGSIQYAPGGLIQSPATGAVYDFSCDKVSAATDLVMDLYATNKPDNGWKTGFIYPIPLTIMYDYYASNGLDLMFTRLYNELRNQVSEGQHRGALAVAEAINRVFDFGSAHVDAATQWRDYHAVQMRDAAIVRYQSMGMHDLTGVLTLDQVQAQVDYIADLERLATVQHQRVTEGARYFDERLARELNSAWALLRAMMQARDAVAQAQSMAGYAVDGSDHAVGGEAPSFVPSRAHGSHVCGRNAAIPIVAPSQDAAIMDVPRTGESTSTAGDYTEPGTRAAGKRPARQYGGESTGSRQQLYISEAQTDSELPIWTPHVAQETTATQETVTSVVETQPSPRTPASISAMRTLITPPSTRPSETPYSQPSPRVRNLLSHLSRLSTSSLRPSRAALLAQFQPLERLPWAPCQWWDTKNGIHCGNCNLCEPIFAIRREEALAAFRPQGVVFFENGQSVREV
ncbi:hypothetical protein LTR49_021455 [Elasticomyces elasticus]|nr:hypothetical protein LTR49_021455 [Elasticomyces elasticus]KAK5761762.1 hypothetical protein LTS12_008017 [Elasticomyces elasticus]